MAANVRPEQEKSLSPKQLEVIPLLVSGWTILAAAKQIGMNEKSIRRWKQEPDFMEALRKAEDEIYDESLKLLKRLVYNAIMTLDDCMSSKASGYVRVAASSKIIDAGLEVHKMAALEREVEQLKALLAEKEFNEA